MVLVPGVVYEAPTRPVGAVLKDLAARGAPGLSAASIMAEEPILVRFVGQSPEAVRNAIAAAVDGRWVTQKDDTHILVADDAKRNKDRATESQEGRALLRERWRAALGEPEPSYTDATASATAKELRAAIAKWQPSVNTPWQVFERVKNGMPKGRLARRALAAFPPDVLLALPEGKWVAFGKGSAKYRPLPKAIATAFASFRAEQVAWTDALRKADISSLMTGPREYYWYPGNEDLAPQQEDSLRVFIRRELTEIRLEANVVSETGWDRSPAEIRIPLEKGGGMPVAEPAVLPNDPPPIYRETSAELGRIVQSPGQAPSAALRRLMLTDEDPMGYGFADRILQGAEAEGVALALSPPEPSSVYWLAGAIEQRGRRRLFAMTRSLMTESTVDGVLILRPDSPMRTREQRADRRVLRDYLAAIADGASLEEKATYHVRVPWHRLDGLAGFWPSIFLANGSESSRADSERTGDRGLLRLYGSLLPGATTAQTLAYPSWPNAAKAAIDEWLYDQRAELKTVPRLLVSGYTWGGHDAYRLFPDGLPTSARLDLRPVKERVARAEGQMLGGVRWRPEAVTPKDIGNSVYQESDPRRFPDYPRPGYSARILTEGTQGRVELSVTLDKRAGVGGVLESLFAPQGRPGTWDKLSPDFVKAVKAEIERARALFAQFPAPKSGEAPPPVR